MRDTGLELANLVLDVLKVKGFMHIDEFYKLTEKNSNYGLRRVQMYFHEEITKHGVEFVKNEKGHTEYLSFKI